jgi:hypothetical protein
MKPLSFFLLLLPFLLPFALKAQKVTKITEPITGQYWWITNQVSLGRPGLSPLTVYLRSSGQGALIYFNPSTMEEIGAADVAVIVTTTDTVIARSTGVQPGNLSTYAREYRITSEDLNKLSKSPVLKVALTCFSQTEVVMVSEKNKDKLMQWVKALLQAAGGGYAL